MKKEHLRSKFSLFFLVFATVITLISSIILCSCNEGNLSNKSWPANLPHHEEGLDYYNLDELKQVAIWLSENCDKDGFKDSKVYQEFYNYMAQGQIWFSNSNGQILCSPKEISKKADPSKCNQDYKLSFPNVRDIDNFLFLRIMGICQDEKADGGKAGLTFALVSVLPVAAQVGDAGCWWGNSSIRDSLQPGGDLYNYLNGADGCFTNNIVKVNKYSQETRNPSLGAAPEKKITSDMFFLPSASEMFPDENVNADIKYLANGGEGEQYDYCKLCKLSTEINSSIPSGNITKGKTNSDVDPVGLSTTSYSNNYIFRTVFTSRNLYVNSNGNNNEDEFKIKFYGVNDKNSFPMLSSIPTIEVKLVSAWTNPVTYTLGKAYSLPVAPCFCF